MGPIAGGRVRKQCAESVCFVCLSHVQYLLSAVVPLLLGACRRHNWRGEDVHKAKLPCVFVSQDMMSQMLPPERGSSLQKPGLGRGAFPASL